MRIANSRVLVPVTFSYSALLDSYNTLIFGVQDITNYVLKSNLTILTSYESELGELEEELRGGLNKLNEFFYGFRLSTKRKRRGAINIIGTLGNALFGLVTEDQLKQVTNALNNLNTKNVETLKNLNIIKTVVGLNTNRLSKFK